MAINVTSLGSSTSQITLSGIGSTFADLISAIDNAILGSNPVRETGWTLYDTVNPANTQVTKVYRSPNIDGLTYKYLILRIHKLVQEINVSTCESWNLTTKTPVNEAFTYYSCAPIHFNLSACDLLIVTHKRFCVVHSYILSEPDLWAGVFEMEREDVNDTAANNFPCWGVMNSVLFTLGAATIGGIGRPLGGTDFPLICMPRTRSGETGVNAAKNFAADYGIVSYPNWLHNTGSAFTQYLGNGGNKFSANAWDITSKMAFPIKPLFNYAGNYVANYGTVCGLKFISPVGNNMSSIKVSANENGNYGAGATDKDHWVLNTHHKPIAAYDLSSITNLVTNTYILPSGARPTDMISTGGFYYFITSFGVSKWNAITNVETVLVSDTTLVDIVYDGEFYVYVGSTANTNTVRRIDIRTDAISAVDISGGAAALAVTDTFVVVSNPPVALNPNVRKIPVNNFSTANVSAAIPIVTGDATNTCVISDMVVDKNGTVFGFCRYTLGAAARIAMFYPDTNAVGIIVLSVALLGIYGGLLLLDENTLLVQYGTTTGTAATQQVRVNGLSSLTLQSPVSPTPTATAVVAGGAAVVTTLSQPITLTKIQGVIHALHRTGAAGGGLQTLSLGGNSAGDLATAFSATGASTVLVPSTTNQFIAYDGSRVIAPTANGFKVYGNLNSQFVASNVTLAQAVIPA
jgi:hypothetical protein